MKHPNFALNRSPSVDPGAIPGRLRAWLPEPGGAPHRAALGGRAPSTPEALSASVNEAAALIEALALDLERFEALPPPCQARLNRAMERLQAQSRRARRQEKREARQRRREDRQEARRAGRLQENSKAARRKRDLERLAAPALPPDAELEAPLRCYICKEPYRQLHPHYRQLCPPCADLNQARRRARADLEGYVAFVTGGRVKIGYACALRLLRAGARVLVSSRRPEEAARRYAEEPDAARWMGRLEVVPLDMRGAEGLEGFAEGLRGRLPHLDVLIHNAAQTLRTHDDAGKSSWVLSFEEISSAELREVLEINVMAPFILSRELLPLMQRGPRRRRFILNVTGVEGQFSRRSQGVHHIHTNMAKAALNMMTRSAARALQGKGVDLLSVDPGWISFQHPGAARPNERFTRPPLDLEDAAARICDPVFRAAGGEPTPSGVLLKDYSLAPW